MTRYIIILCLFIAGCNNTKNADEKQSVFGGDLQHTGYYRGKGVDRNPSLKWQFKTDGIIRAAVAVGEELVYLASGDGNLYAIASENGEEQWRFRTEYPMQSTPALSDGMLFVQDRAERFYAIDTRTGGELWHFDPDEVLPFQMGFDPYLSSPLAVDGLVYFGSGDGCLYALNARDGKLRWKFSSGARIRTAPAASGDQLFFGNMNGRLFSVHRQTGAELWHYDIEGADIDSREVGFDRTAILSSPTVAASNVLFGGRDGYLYCLDSTTGEFKWRFNHEISWVISSPAVAGHLVYAGSSDGHFLQAVNLETGKEEWRFSTRTAIWSSPAVSDSSVYFGDFDGNIIAADCLSGQERWRFSTAGFVLAAPVLADGILYVGSDDGYLYALTEGPPPSAPRLPVARAVYSEEIPGWFARSAQSATRDFFKGRGYREVDSKGLVDFMQAQMQTDSSRVVVFANNYVPAAAVGDSTASCLLRRYLAAGGKLVFLGPNPLVYKRSGDKGPITAIDFSIPERILAVRYPGKNTDGFGGWYQARPTPAGEQLGLKRWWVGACAVDTAQVDIVLAQDEYKRAAAWIKFYGSNGGQVVQLWIERGAPQDLREISKVIENLPER